jgi:hypothetical protein
MDGTLNLISSKKDKHLKRLLCLLLAGTLLASLHAWAESEGDDIINEIGNSGTKKDACTGGDFVELFVLKPEGVRLAGWYLTDLSTLTGTAKETEGRVRFSYAEGSILRQVIPQGTFILVWLSSKDSVEAGAKHHEDIALNDGSHRIVVFAYNSPRHMDGQERDSQLDVGADELSMAAKTLHPLTRSEVGPPPQLLTGLAEKSVGSSHVAPDFWLRSNYPNPFNPRTTIAFMVPRTGKTAVRVLNMLGQKVALLLDNVVEGGQPRTMNFQPSGLSSGVYFLQLEFEGRQLVQKMVYAK